MSLSLNTASAQSMQPVAKHYETFEEAIEAGSYEGVERLIQEGQDPNGKAKSKFRPLHRAAMKGDIKIAKLLLDNGAQVDGGGYRRTPLFLATVHGCLKLAKQLLEAGANPNPEARWPHFEYRAYGWDRLAKATPLHWAIWAEDEALTKTLLEHGAEVNIPHEDLIPPPIHLAVEKNNLKLIETLVEHQADINWLDCNATRPIETAAAKGFTQIVKELLDLGARRPTPDSRTAYSVEVKQLFEEASAVPQLRSLCLDTIYDRMGPRETKGVPPLLLNFNKLSKPND